MNVSDKGYISDFDARKGPGSLSSTSGDNGPIDFSAAQKIEDTTGSTCDVFITVYHDKRVLVKRLKEELKNKVLNLKALEKEFNIGFNLKHNSLPTYIEFHKDYLIMEYIEGETLAALIKKKDPYLSKEKNICKLLAGLIDVIAYLHNHNITHGDVKADNIILTSKHRNVALIDLDKCYTSARNSTPGSPMLYAMDADKAGHPDADYHGVGILIDRMAKTIPGFPKKKFQKVRNLCMGDNVDADTIMELLGKASDKFPLNKKRDREWMLIVGVIIFLLAGLFIVGIMVESKSPTIESETQSELVEESPVVIVPENIETSQQAVPLKNETSVPLPATASQVSRESQYQQEIENLMKEKVKPFRLSMKEVEKAFDNQDATKEELSDLVYELHMAHSQMVQEAYSFCEARYPDIPPVDVQLAVARTKALTEINKEFSNLLEKIVSKKNGDVDYSN